MIKRSNRAVLYARFSSDNQRSESIDAQIRAMKVYCKQNHIAIVDTYIDEARSATTDHRPAFQQMIADSAEHIFDIVLVHKLDRFARNRYDSAVYKKELKKHGVVVRSVLENLDDSPESIMMESVLEGMSEYYSQNLAREVMKGMRETALQCKHTGGKPPLGYDVDPENHRLVVNQHEAEVVKLIFTMYGDGYGYSEILEKLHETGERTKNGNEFMKNSLYSILTNPKYGGVYVFNRSSARSISGTRNTHLLKENEDVIAIEGGCPRIVEPEIFDQVQERISRNKHTGGRNNAKRTYLLSGKVFCSECGRAMVGNARTAGRGKGMYITYRCPSKRYSCTNKEINQGYLESYVLKLLEEEIFNPKAMKTIVSRIEEKAGHQGESVAEEEHELQKKIQELLNAIGNIADVLASGVRSDTLIEKLEALEAEKAKQEAALARLTAREEAEDAVVIDPKLLLNRYRELRQSPSSPDFKAFVQGFIGRIEVGRYRIEIDLKSGLEVFPDLNTQYQVRRETVYKWGEGR